MTVRGWLAGALLAAISPVVIAEPLHVAVSILPEQWLVQQIGGDAVQVSTLVGRGMEPEDYAPTPHQIASFEHNQLYFAIGIPFETSWLPRLQQHARQMQVVNLREEMKLRRIEAHAHDDHDDDGVHDRTHEGIADPHVWLDPVNMTKMAERVADTLADRLPAQSKAIRSREQALIQRLDQTDRAIAQQLAPWAGSTFMVYHPAFGYFADRYRLRQLPIELGGKEPGTRSLGRAINSAREHDIHNIFVQKQFSQSSAERIARAVDARVAVLDPLAENYLQNLHDMADALAAGFVKADD